MIAIIGKDIVIPYGSAGVRSDVLERLRQNETEGLDKPGAPVIVQRAGSAARLRISSIVHPFTRPPAAQDLAHANAQLAFIEQHCASLNGQFAKPGRRFIARYFSELRGLVRADEAALMAKAGALAGLVELDHWCLGALLPLPRAHIYCPPDGQESVIEAGDFVPVDFAFWTGRELVAVVIAGGTLMPARRRALARLSEGGARLEEMQPADLEGPEGSRGLLGRLGPAFLEAVADEPYPSSPFRGRGVPAPVAG